MDAGQRAVALADGVRTASITYAVDKLATVGLLLRSDAVQNDDRYSPPDLFGGQRSAGLIPPHRHPGGVVDEAVHQVDVDVLVEVALLDALVEQVDLDILR